MDLKTLKNKLPVVLLFIASFAVAQDAAKYAKLPQAVFLDLINNTVKFDVNHAREFKHAALPKSYYNTFLSFIKDSVATPVPGLRSPAYYNFSLANGKIINGDIYWNDTQSYIIFRIEDKTYVNYFTKEGVTQIKTLFKL